jgi:hypothetical protein
MMLLMGIGLTNEPFELEQCKLILEVIWMYCKIERNLYLDLEFEESRFETPG